MRRAAIVTVVSLLLAGVVLFVGVSQVTAQVNAAPGNVRAVFGIFGMPILIGLKQAGHRRLDFGWGALVLLIVPFLIGQASAMWHIMKRRPAMT
jgi:hypothetical protein